MAITLTADLDDLKPEEVLAVLEALGLKITVATPAAPKSEKPAAAPAKSTRATKATKAAKAEPEPEEEPEDDDEPEEYTEESLSGKEFTLKRLKQIATDEFEIDVSDLKDKPSLIEAILEEQDAEDEPEDDDEDEPEDDEDEEDEPEPVKPVRRRRAKK